MLNREYIPYPLLGSSVNRRATEPVSAEVFGSVRIKHPKENSFLPDFACGEKAVTPNPETTIAHRDRQWAKIKGAILDMD